MSWFDGDLTYRQMLSIKVPKPTEVTKPDVKVLNPLAECGGGKMVTYDEYVNAKELISRYIEQQHMQEALVCNLENICLRRGDDGHWLEFRTLAGNHSVINMENCFSQTTQLHRNILQWAREQQTSPKIEVKP